MFHYRITPQLATTVVTYCKPIHYKYFITDVIYQDIYDRVNNICQDIIKNFTIRINLHMYLESNHIDVIYYIESLFKTGVKERELRALTKAIYESFYDPSHFFEPINVEQLDEESTHNLHRLEYQRCVNRQYSFDLLLMDDEFYPFSFDHVINILSKGCGLKTQHIDIELIHKDLSITMYNLCYKTIFPKTTNGSTIEYIRRSIKGDKLFVDMMLYLEVVLGTYYLPSNTTCLDAMTMVIYRIVEKGTMF